MTNQSNQQHRGGRTAPNNNGGGKQAAKAPGSNGSSSSTQARPSGSGPPTVAPPPQLPEDDPFPSGSDPAWQTDILSKKWFGIQVQEMCDDHEFDLSDKPCWRRHRGVVKEFGGLVMGRLATAIGAPTGGKATAWNRDEQGGIERSLSYLAACSKTGCSLDGPDHVAVNSARLYGTGSKTATRPGPVAPKNNGGGGQQSSPKAKGGGSGQQVGSNAQVSEVVEVKPEAQDGGDSPVQSDRSAVMQEGPAAPERERYARPSPYRKDTKIQADFKKRNGGRGIATVTHDIQRQFPHLTLTEAQEVLWLRDAKMIKAAALVDEGQVAPEAPLVDAGVQDLPIKRSEMAELGESIAQAMAQLVPPPPPDPRKEAAREKAEKEAASDLVLYAKLQDPAKTGVQLLVALSRGDHYETVAACAMAPHAPEEMLVALSEHSELIVVKAVAATPSALPDEAAVRLAIHPDVEVRRILAARPHPSIALQQAICDQDDFEAKLTLVRDHPPLDLDHEPMHALFEGVHGMDVMNQIPFVVHEWLEDGCGPNTELRSQYFDEYPETFDTFDRQPEFRIPYFAKFPDVAERYYSTRPEMEEADRPEEPEEPNEPPEPDGAASTGEGSGWRAKAKQKWDEIQEEAAPDPNASWLPDPNQPTFREWLRNRSS